MCSEGCVMWSGGDVYMSELCGAGCCVSRRVSKEAAYLKKLACYTPLHWYRPGQPQECVAAHEEGHTRLSQLAKPAIPALLHAIHE